MHFVNIFAIAVALAMDAFAVSITTGVSLKDVSFRQTFRLSWHFGLFQVLMPIIGWRAGLSIHTYIESYDHWPANWQENRVRCEIESLYRNNRRNCPSRYRPEYFT